MPTTVVTGDWPDCTPDEAVAAVDVVRAAFADETPEMRAYLDSTQALADHATYYASVGWPVFPLVAGGKVPVTTNGVKDATTDAATVADWWRTMPSANIGVACGARFDAIDIDAPDGFQSWAEFTDGLRAAGHEHPPILAIAVTGNGGRHFFIAPVPSARNGVALGGKVGLDYRAGGGYVLVAPSRLTNAGRYFWSLAPDERLLK